MNLKNIFLRSEGIRFVMNISSYGTILPAFHTNLYKTRPEYKTPIPNLYLAGDWVKLPSPAMLMEAATTSALYAANDILRQENLQEEPVFSVPLKGIFA